MLALEEEGHGNACLTCFYASRCSEIAPRYTPVNSRKQSRSGLPAVASSLPEVKARTQMGHQQTFSTFLNRVPSRIISISLGRGSHVVLMILRGGGDGEGCEGHEGEGARSL